MANQPYLGEEVGTIIIFIRFSLSSCGMIKCDPSTPMHTDVPICLDRSSWMRRTWWACHGHASRRSAAGLTVCWPRRCTMSALTSPCPSWLGLCIYSAGGPRILFRFLPHLASCLGCDGSRSGGLLPMFTAKVPLGVPRKHIWRGTTSRVGCGHPKLQRQPYIQRLGMDSIAAYVFKKEHASLLPCI
jgi:hypothetical protein